MTKNLLNKIKGIGTIIVDTAREFQANYILHKYQIQRALNKMQKVEKVCRRNETTKTYRPVATTNTNCGYTESNPQE